MNQEQIKELKDLCLRILDKQEELSRQLRALPSNPEIPAQPEQDMVMDYLDVCQALHISVRHLRRLHNTKELVGFKIGRRRFYRHSEVQRFIRSMEVNNSK